MSEAWMTRWDRAWVLRRLMGFLTWLVRHTTTAAIGRQRSTRGRGRSGAVRSAPFSDDGADQREGLEVGVGVVVLSPSAVDGHDHLLGRVDVDVLTEGADRRKGAGVDAGRTMRQHPPLVAVSRRDIGPEPTEAGGRAVGLAGQIAPAGRQHAPTIERFAVVQHQQAEAAD